MVYRGAISVANDVGDTSPVIFSFAFLICGQINFSSKLFPSPQRCVVSGVLFAWSISFFVVQV